jgi:hypothetical protein
MVAQGLVKGTSLGVTSKLICDYCADSFWYSILQVSTWEKSSKTCWEKLLDQSQLNKLPLGLTGLSFESPIRYRLCTSFKRIPLVLALSIGDGVVVWCKAGKWTSEQPRTADLPYWYHLTTIWCNDSRGPGGPPPYRLYVDSGTVWMCIAALAPSCPVVAPAGMIYFIVVIPMLRWLLVFVYRPKFDGGGDKWPYLHDMVISSLILGQVSAIMFSPFYRQVDMLLRKFFCSCFVPW